MSLALESLGGMHAFKKVELVLFHRGHAVFTETRGGLGHSAKHVGVGL